MGYLLEPIRDISIIIVVLVWFGNNNNYYKRANKVFDFEFLLLSVFFGLILFWSHSELAAEKQQRWDFNIK